MILVLPNANIFFGHIAFTLKVKYHILPKSK